MPCTGVERGPGVSLLALKCFIGSDAGARSTDHCAAEVVDDGEDPGVTEHSKTLQRSWELARRWPDLFIGFHLTDVEAIWLAWSRKHGSEWLALDTSGPSAHSEQVEAA